MYQETEHSSYLAIKLYTETKWFDSSAPAHALFYFYAKQHFSLYIFPESCMPMLLLRPRTTVCLPGQHLPHSPICSLPM